MKNKLMKNLSLKILSVVAAFLFWLVIINVTDPTTVKTFYGIPVQVLNENVITSANQVYEIESGDSVNITVKGKRSLSSPFPTMISRRRQISVSCPK